MKAPITFEIIGLFGRKNVSLKIKSHTLVLVGPNGIGKSTVSNIFYFFVSRQWNRLVDYKFDEIRLEFSDGTDVRAKREEITGLSQLDNVFDTIRPDSRFYHYLEALKSHGVLEQFVGRGRNTLALTTEISSILGISRDEARSVALSIRRRLYVEDDDGPLFSKPRVLIEKRLAEMLPGRSLYLPTYRRIERDIQEIFPDYESKMRRLDLDVANARSASHYVDLVSFGMEDVRKSVHRKLRSLRDYSLAQFNNLSGLYLRDVIRGKAHEYSHKEIASLTEGSLSTILGRVSEEVLSVRDKDLLRSKIIDLKSRKAGPREPNESYLAHYFTRLMSVSKEISQQEIDIVRFVDVCNAYLNPSKEMIYDDARFHLAIVDDGGREIDFSALSSGEKQVVSLFAHLYLDESKDQIVVIDEPELSLSVPWQKRLLSDISESPYCRFLLAVTHSPFIYEELPLGAAVDLRRFTRSN